MAHISKIEWTDATFNPWIGCTKVSPACDHCYAAVSTPSRTLGVKWGAGNPRHRTSVANWQQPIRWNLADFQECGGCGWRGEVDTLESDQCPACGKHDKLKPARRRVFCASLADWLDKEVSAEWLAGLLDLIRRTPNLDWQLLTKRIGNWESRLTVAHQHVVKTMGGGTSEYAAHPLWTLGMWIQDWLAGKAPANAWIGATICNQAEADRDVSKLLSVPAAVRFLSVEPMLGPIDLRWLITEPTGNTRTYHGKRQMELRSTGLLHWVITGGESSSNARPSNPQWFRDIRDQCALAGVAYVHKQNGAWVSVSEVEGAGVHHTFPDGRTVRRVGKLAAGRTLDGVTYTEFPEATK